MKNTKSKGFFFSKSIFHISISTGSVVLLFLCTHAALDDIWNCCIQLYAIADCLGCGCIG